MLLLKGLALVSSLPLFLFLLLLSPLLDLLNINGPVELDVGQFVDPQILDLLHADARPHHPVHHAAGGQAQRCDSRVLFNQVHHLVWLIMGVVVLVLLFTFFLRTRLNSKPWVNPSNFLEIIEKFTRLKIKIIELFFAQKSVFDRIRFQNVRLFATAKLVAHEFQKFENLQIDFALISMLAVDNPTFVKVDPAQELISAQILPQNTILDLR